MKNKSKSGWRTVHEGRSRFGDHCLYVEFDGKKWFIDECETFAYLGLDVYVEHADYNGSDYVYVRRRPCGTRTEMWEEEWEVLADLQK